MAPRHPVAALDEEGRRARHVEAIGQHEVALQHARVATRQNGVRTHIVAHPFMPGLGAILGANDLAGIRLSAQHRRDEGVDRHVAHLSIDRLHGAAVGAVGVGEDDNLALTLAEDLFDSILKRPFLPALAGPFAKTFIRKVRLLDRIDQAAVEHVARLIIDIEDPVLNHDLPHAGHGRLLDSVRLEAGRLHERILDTLGRCCKDGDGKART